MKTIVVTTLALYQTKFWVELANQMVGPELGMAFISFDERSSQLIKENNYSVLEINGIDYKNLKSLSEVNNLFTQLQIKNPRLTTSHERFVFGITKEKLLFNKFFQYYKKCDHFLSYISEDNEIVLVQELGGFISVLAAHNAALKLKINSYFIEPSFFNKRYFLLKNKLINDDLKLNKFTKEEKIKVQKYIRNKISNKKLVIPSKDSAHYNIAYKKILKSKNWRRFFEKIFDQFFLRKHQEFGYNFRYALSHLNMVINSKFLASHYTNFSKANKFIYFPLHVPNDVSLTLRSPEYLDQLSLVEFIARNVPKTYSLVIKEHPAQIGAFNHKKINELLKRYEHLFLLHPETNNFDIIEHSSAVISINSKTGAEAILKFKPVLVLGHSFYSSSPFVERINKLSELNNKLIEMLEKKYIPNKNKIDDFFASLWSKTFSGDLYDMNPKNIEQFSTSLKDNLKMLYKK